MMHQEIIQMFNLNGKVGFVTGGAVHLGLDIASILAAAGSNLIITSRTQKLAEKSAQALRSKYRV